MTIPQNSEVITEKIDIDENTRIDKNTMLCLVKKVKRQMINREKYVFNLYNRQKSIYKNSHELIEKRGKYIGADSFQKSLISL